MAFRLGRQRRPLHWRIPVTLPVGRNPATERASHELPGKEPMSQSLNLTVTVEETPRKPVRLLSFPPQPHSITMAKFVSLKLGAGDLAPEFTATSQDGSKVSLSDFRGKNVILYFYPKDDTPGCTKEACAFRDEFADFKAKGAVVLGVSTDPVKSHAKFVQK